MLLSRHHATRRPGNMIPLTCVLLVVILGMVAFAVDVSWMALTKSELQNAADSAAMAGANKLADNYVLYNLVGQTDDAKKQLITSAISTVKTTAKTYASYNAAGGVTSLALLDSDIDVGFTDSKGAYKSYSTDTTNYPNTVKVVMRRDSSANAPLALFFAPVLGMDNLNVTASAGATLYGGTINSFKSSTMNSGMLPVTYDVNAWNAFLLTGQNPDGASSKDANGNPALVVYPSIKATGNFGLLSLNDSHIGASTMSSWINNGVPAADIQALINNKLIPISAHDPAAWDWNGENGFKGSNVMDVNQQVGKTFILPLFKPKSEAPYEAGTGQASNYNYNIVQFVGVKIMQSPDINRTIMIQPAAVSDPNMTFTDSTVVPIGTTTTSSSYTAFAGARLTN